MNLRNIVLTTVSAVLLIVGSVPAQFYYSGGIRIPLIVDKSRILVKLDSSLTSLEHQNLIDGTANIGGTITDSALMHGFVLCFVNADAEYAALLDSLRSKVGIIRVEPYYATQDNSPMVVGLSFCAKFRPDVSRSVIDSVNESFGVVISGRSTARPQAYYLKAGKSCHMGILDLANRYYELPITEFAHPNFSRHATLDSYTLFDYYHQFQWQIKKMTGDFNVASVWDFAGLDTQITVAVVDDGLAAPQDLPSARVLQGFDFVVGGVGSFPASSQFHGTACASVIAASHTTDSLAGLEAVSGIVSMSPASIILPIRVIPEYLCDERDSVYVCGIDYAWCEGAADVISCSWHLGGPLDDMTDALLQATLHGRRIDAYTHLGCPVIFSSGNTKLSPSSVAYPARLPQCFAVGAIDSADMRYLYSRYDSTLDLVATSGPLGHDVGSMVNVWSLDQPGIQGANPVFLSDCPSTGENDWDINCSFGGTSASCAFVAGAAALILSKNPMLTYSEVYDILRNSAVKDLAWGTLPDTPSVEYGYGRLDVFRAILSIARGDVDNDNVIDQADVTALIDYIYLYGPEPFPSTLLGDCNCDGRLNLQDVLVIIEYVNQGGPPPATPCYKF